MEQGIGVYQGGQQLSWLHSSLLSVRGVQAWSKDVIGIAFGRGFDFSHIMLAGLVKDELVPGEGEGGSISCRCLLSANQPLLVTGQFQMELRPNAVQAFFVTDQPCSEVDIFWQMHKQIFSYGTLVLKIEVFPTHIDVLHPIFFRVCILLGGRMFLFLIIKLMREFPLGDGERLLLDGLLLLLFRLFGLFILVEQECAGDFRQVDGKMKALECLFLQILWERLLIAAWFLLTVLMATQRSPPTSAGDHLLHGQALLLLLHLLLTLDLRGGEQDFLDIIEVGRLSPFPQDYTAAGKDLCLLLLSHRLQAAQGQDYTVCSNFFRERRTDRRCQVYLPSAWPSSILLARAMDIVYDCVKG